MTRDEALTALAGLGIAGKMAGFLLGDAERHGCGAHLEAEVTYAPGLGFAIVGHRSAGGEGVLVAPCGAGN